MKRNPKYVKMNSRRKKTVAKAKPKVKVSVKGKGKPTFFCGGDFGNRCR